MRACILVIWLFVSGFCGVLPAADSAAVTWVVIQDDDGAYESHWGCAMTPSERICKVIELGISPAQVQAAQIEYVVAVSPYHSRTRQHVDSPKEGLFWANVLVLLNGEVVARRPGLELMSKGSHRIAVPVDLLEEGENRIEFGWEPIGEGSPPDASYGYFYIGIDTDRSTRRSLASSDGGKTWRSDCLRPGAKPEPRFQGEFLVRLEVALPTGDPADRTSERR